MRDSGTCRDDVAGFDWADWHGEGFCFVCGPPRVRESCHAELTAAKVSFSVLKFEVGCVVVGKAQCLYLKNDES